MAKGLDPNNDRDRRLLAYDLGLSDERVGYADRFDAAIDATLRKGASAEHVQQVAQAWRDAGIRDHDLIGSVTAGPLRIVPAELADRATISSPEPLPESFLGAKSIDRAVIAGGRVIDRFGQFVDANPVAQYAMEGLGILLGGVPRFLAAQAFNATPLADAIQGFAQGARESVKGVMRSGFEGAGYASVDARDGAQGTATALELAGTVLLGRLVIKDWDPKVYFPLQRRAKAFQESHIEKFGERYRVRPDEEWHHTVPRNEPWAVDLRNKLDDLGIEINDPRNAVFLPKSAAIDNPFGKVLHSETQGVFGPKYGEYLRNTFRDVTGQAEAFAALAKIQSELLHGIKPWVK